MLEIREYRETDKTDVWALHNEALGATGAHAGNGPWDDDLNEIKKVYTDAGGAFLVGLIEDRIVAMGALKRLNQTTAEIKRMRVKPAYQRRGHGAAILTALEHRAYELEIFRLTLDTTDFQMAAQALYEKYGYRETGRAQVGRFNLIYYEKNLEPHNKPLQTDERRADGST